MERIKPESKNFLIDLDGVLTNGKQYITQSGEKLFKAFHSRDTAAIREMIFNGWRVVIVTADDCPSGTFYAEKVGAEFIHLRDKSKIPFKDNEFLAVGDSSWDIPMLKKSLISFCPLDASEEVKQTVQVILTTKGGSGVIEEIWRMINQSNAL